MNIHFEYGPKEKAPLGELVELCDVALALIHERGQLLKLLRENPVSEECDHIFNATLKRLKNLERASHQVQLAFHNPVAVEDGRGGVGEEKHRLSSFPVPPQYAQQSAGTITGIANLPPVCTENSNPDVVVMRSAQKGV